MIRDFYLVVLIDFWLLIVSLFYVGFKLVLMVSWLMYFIEYVGIV